MDQPALLGIELHVRNVPNQLTENSFKRFITPHLNNLNIQDTNSWKPKDKNFARITFLRFTDGQRFLERHGQVQSQPGKRRPPNPPGFVQLKLNGQPIYFQRSNQPANDHLLGVLESERKKRIDNLHLPMAPIREKIIPMTFDCLSVSCGVWDFKKCEQNTELVYTPQVRWDGHGTAKFGSKAMILKFPDGKRIDFKYASTLEIIAEAGAAPAFMFSLLEPPQMYETVGGGQGIGPVEGLMAALSLQAPTAHKKGFDRYRVASLSDDHIPIAGNCLVYCINLQSNARIDSRMEESVAARMHKLGKARGLPQITHRSVPVMRTLEPYVNGLRRMEEAFWESKLPFKLLFQLQKLVSNNYLTPYKVMELMPAVKSLAVRATENVAVHTVHRLASQINYPSPESDPTEFDITALVQKLKENEEHFVRNGTIDEGIKLDAATSNVVIIHRCDVTPASIRLSGPQQEATNRVLRKYPKDHDYFMRVRFCDEGGNPVQYNPKVSNDRIYNKRFKEILSKGVWLAGRKFSFLAFSHSSLRSQTCWLMSPFVNEGSILLNQMLIADLGDFSLIQSPAKCAARIGQAFSDTPTAVPLRTEVQTIRDVELNNKVFSDGVGTMSPGVMAQIWAKLPNKGLMPTCFQIRYKGAKGMIAVDRRLQGNVLKLRPSMVKFEAPGDTSTVLEICEGAWKPLPLYLNRQLIKILEDMGTKDEFFLDLQAKEVERIRAVNSNPQNASRFLARQQIGVTIHLSYLVAQLYFLQIDYQSDGFLKDVVELAQLVELRALKHKTRIPVSKGWHLHGIMDETGELEEGEIFCIVNTDGVSRVITGNQIIVSRAPCVHPGDVQFVNAVNVHPGSPLHALYNCVVFSQKGERDLPSQLGGGDLDGDRYFVIWDENARPQRYYSPADYPRKAPVDLGRTVTMDDMTDHFIQFMETDQLGRCAVMHRVYADQQERGCNDPICLQLAEMHSTAVDFSKTGIALDVTKFPRSPLWRPDFEAPGPYVEIEEKGISFVKTKYRDEDDDADEDDDYSHYRYYESKKILGKLYRAIDERQIFEDITNRARINTIQASDAVQVVWGFVMTTCKLIQFEHLLPWAADLREDYEEALHHLTYDYAEVPSRPLTELEVVVGNILGRTGAQTRRQLNDSTTLKEAYDIQATWIVDRIRKDGDDYSPEALERSIACLAISLDETLGRKGKVRFLSFKYLAAAVCLREVDRM